MSKETTDDLRDQAWQDAVRALKARSLSARFFVMFFQLLVRIGHRPRQWLGKILGSLAPRIAPRRSRIVEQNLALCFPELSPEARKTLVHAHWRALVQTFVDRAVLWFGSRQDILDLVSLEGFEHILNVRARGQRIMLLAPHLIGLDAAATRLSLEGYAGATLYAPQSNPDMDAIVRLGRGRFEHIHLVSRKDGVRGLIRMIRQDLPIYYLPDMDLGARGAVFVPFFGVPAATQTATAQLARQFKMVVIPTLAYRDPQTGRYQVKILPPLEDFPGEGATPEEDAACLNQHLQDWIEEAPEQYYWVHRRFKTRPPNEPPLYTNV